MKFTTYGVSTVAVIGFMGLLSQQLMAQDAPATVRAEPVGVSVPADAPQGKVRIGIGAIEILPSLQRQLTANGQGTQAQRAVETIEGQMMDALQNSRKFEIVARNDLDELLKEQRLTPGVIVDVTDPKAAVPAKIKGLKYLVLTTIDDFVDTEQSVFSQEMGMAASRRTLRMSAIVRVYDTSTGVLLESMAVPVQMEATGTARSVPGDQAKNPNAADDSAYVALVNQLAKAVAQRVVEAIYPGKVIAVTGDFVTINRGAGTMIDRNQVWEVFAVGRELKDPDTGELLGKEEMKIGEVIIIDVLPKFAKGQVYGENRGIAAGSVIRPKMQMQPAAAPAGAIPGTITPTMPPH